MSTAKFVVGFVETVHVCAFEKRVVIACRVIGSSTGVAGGLVHVLVARSMELVAMRDDVGASLVLYVSFVISVHDGAW